MISQLTLAAGDIAPDFELASTFGERIHLYGTLPHSAVVLFFYLAAFTPVCTAEVCSFRDSANQFADLNATIYGIGSGGHAVVKRFAEFNRLPFPLLLDPGNEVRKLYGVPKVLGILPGRATYVIAQDRRILRIIQNGFESAPHIANSLNSLRGRGAG